MVDTQVSQLVEKRNQYSMMTKKLKLLGSGNESRRSFFILSKEDSFFSLFPLFLIGCGFKNIGVYEDYQQEKPNINSFLNKIEHFKNEEYEIDLIYTIDRIILIIRTDECNRDKLISGIKRIAEF
jgi:hypothetical protein